MMRALTVFLAGATLLACTQELPRTTLHLRRPVDIAVACVKSEQATDPSLCTEVAAPLFGFVLNTERGSVARLDLATGQFVDDDKFIPGISPTLLASRPASLVLSSDFGHVFVAIAGGSALARVDVVSLDVVTQSLPGRPADVIDAGDELLVALPDQSAVARVSKAGFGELAQVDAMALPEGSPLDLALSTDGTVLYVGHADRAYVSVVDLATGAETARVGLAGACSDDLDNNGDGLADAADWGCRGGFGEEMSAPVNAPALVAIPLPQASAPQCMNGVDDDGDGLVDYPDEPDCIGPTAALESGARPPVMARLALAPAGDVLYALNVRDRTGVVINTETLSRVDVNTDGLEGANPLFRRLGRTDIHLIGVPVDLALAVHTDRTNADGALPDQLLAYVASATGQVEVLEVENSDGTPVHRERDGDESDQTSITTTPQLFEGREEIVLGGNRRADLASFGEFNREPLVGDDPSGQDRDTLRSFGVRLPQDTPRVARNEAWEITHGGPILEREAKLGVMDFDNNVFQTPEPTFCSHGVEVGDRLVVRHAPPIEGCEAFQRGRAFVYEITAVTQNTLALADTGRVFELREKVPDGTDGPSLDGAEFAIDGPLTAACFEGALAYEVRVKKGEYTVIGTTTGYLHPWAPADDGSCVRIDGEADAQPAEFYAGRAKEWTQETTPAVCPVLEGSIDTVYAGEWFTNPVFSIRMLPGCLVDEKTITAAETTEDLRWRFIVNSAHSPRLIGGRSLANGVEPTMGNPRSIRWVPAQKKIYVTDAGQEKVVEIQVGDDLITRTFF